MQAVPLIRVAVLQPFATFLDQIGAPTGRLLGQFNLSTALLTDLEQLVPLVQSAAFVEAAAKAEGLETLGLVVGQQTQALHLGMFGQLLCSSLTLYDLLITAERIIGMHNSGERVELVWRPDAVWLRNQLDALDRYPSAQAQQFSLMVYLNILRLALGPTWQPPEICLASPPSRSLLAMEEFEGVQIRFGMPYTAIKIPRDRLHLPLSAIAAPTPQPDLATFYSSAPAQDLVGSVQQLIHALLPQGYPDAAVVAMAAGVSVRSLQRKLTEEGVSYARLVDRVRFERAVTLLKQPDVRLIDIAAELGYTDAANFTRAFKRWTGASPREYRSLHYSG
jgi:AraC-like DNA-binding protein